MIEREHWHPLFDYKASLFFDETTETNSHSSTSNLEINVLDLMRESTKIEK